MWITRKRSGVSISLLGRFLLIPLGLLLFQARASAGPIAPPGACNLPDDQTEPEARDLAPTFSLDFEDGYGVTVASGHGSALCENNACPETDVLGRQSLTGAVVFDGIDDYLALPQTVSGALDESFTVAAWIRGGDFEQTEQVILGDSTGNLRLSVRDKRLFMTLDGVHVNSAEPRLLDHKWHHVVWRYDSETGEQALFLDGYLKNTGESAGESAGEIPDDARLQVGCAGRGGYYEGALDDISIYDRGLSESEIFNLANPNPQGANVDFHFLDLKVELIGSSCGKWWWPGQAYYERLFGSVADALYDMTEGGMVLRNVFISKGWWDWPKVRFHYDQEQPSVGLNGFANRYVGIYMPRWVGEHDLMHPEDLQTGHDRAAYVLTHLLGHDVLGLGDEGQALHVYNSDPIFRWLSRPEDPHTLLHSTLMGDPIAPAGTYEEVCVERYPWWEFWHWGQCARTEVRRHPGSPSLAQLSTDANFDIMRTGQGRLYGTSAWATLIRPPSQDPYQAHLTSSVFNPARIHWPHLATHAPDLNSHPPAEIKEEARDYLYILWWPDPHDRVIGGWDQNRIHWPHLATHAPDLNSHPPAEINEEARDFIDIGWYPVPGAGASRESHSDAGAAAMPNGIVRLYVLDVSGAMAAEHLQQAKAALKHRVDHMPDGDTLGLITFSSGVTVTQPFIALDVDHREALKATIDGIALGDAGVATGDALDHAVAMLTAADVPTGVYKSLHIIGTGETTTGQTLPTAGRSVDATYVDLYAFHYETSPDAGHALRELAESNHGVYTKVTNQTELASALKAAEAATSFHGIVGLKTDYQSITSGPAFTATFGVNESLAALNLLVGYWGEMGTDTLLLEPPSGESLAFDLEEDCEDWGEPGDPLAVCTLAVEDPAPGTWLLWVDTQDASEAAPTDVTYWVDGVSEPDALRFPAYVTQADGESLVQYPEPMVLSAAVMGAHRVAGLGVTATVEAPNGEYDLLPLRDDGIVPDETADDGLYSGYVDYWTSGEYLVTVNFTNESGEAGYPNGDDPLEPLGHPLDRYAEMQFSVVDWQPDDHDDDYTAAPTVLTPDNAGVPGRIDYDTDDPGWIDVDTFVFTPTQTSRVGPPGTFNPEDLTLRVYQLGLGMDPDVYVYDQHGDLLQVACLDFTPDSCDYLATPITVTAEMVGEPLYVELSHWDPDAVMGTYRINVGPYRYGDPAPDLGVGLEIGTTSSLGEGPDGAERPEGMMAKTGLSGDLITFTHVITNTGVRPDQVLVDARASSGWTLALLDLPGTAAQGTRVADGSSVVTRTIEIEPQSQVSFVLSTTVPPSPTVQLGDEGTFVIVATSQTAPQWEHAMFRDLVWVAETAPTGRLYLPVVTRQGGASTASTARRSSR